ncbi:MAG: FKBP-type peptidyl-prolyl cis-trans isomerase [Candidatus Aenigmatarchaeota archaeon]|nr:peptidylprolyl isomerase [Candidatus Aenigmarchaeota archaeon]
MQTGDFIRLAYSGKIKGTDQLFDQADSAPVIVGAGYILPSLDAKLADMMVGQKKTVELTPEEAFGPRDPKLVRVVPEAEFKRHGTKPVPGMPIEADNMRGRVISVASGRVTVDFNHPLAGKVLTFDLEIKKKIELLDEKIKAIAEFYSRMPMDKLNVHVKGTEVELEIPPTVHAIYKKKIADDIMKWLDLTKVKFVEVFEKPKEK